jgi:transmembrane sensor
MNQPRLAQVLREEASHWWVRLDSGELGDAEREAFEAWRAQSPAHRAAFAEICALWGELDALKPRFVPNRAAAGSRKPARALWAVAASLLLALIVIPLLATRPEYRSEIGEIRTIKLEDGSTVYLSSGSALDTDFGPARRHLELLEGEAWFEVAHDPARPFVVRAGNGTATALGTVYDVKNMDGKVQVTVIESRVEVDYRSPGASNRKIVLAAGEQTIYTDDSGPAEVRSSDLDTVSAWRRGRLVFENKPLGEVVTELGRYHRGMIVITDKALRERPVNGVFRTDDPASVVAALENSLGLRSTRFTDYLILLHP